MSPRKRVLVITTGGTISMSAEAGHGAVPTLDGRALVGLVPDLADLADVNLLELCNLPSPAMTLDLMQALSRTVSEQLARYDGVVITHGTDTVEETAYFLWLTLDTKKPVVLTAAMRSNDELGLDGPRNLLGAVRVAADDESFDRGVVLVVNDEIFSAREVYKVSTALTNAFGSPNYGVLGFVDLDRVVYVRKPEIREKYHVRRIDQRVDLIKTYVDCGRAFVDCAIDGGAHGLVIEAMGRGNVPPPVKDGIVRALDARLPVVIASRVPNGRVLGVYAYEGGGRQLEELGCILAADLKAEKARLKLMVLLGAGLSHDEIRHCFSFDNKLGRP